MGIEWVRVDDRLIHGQVTVGWVPHVRAQLIIIADDTVAEDELLGEIYRAAAPPEVTVRILSVERAAEQLSTDRFRGRRVFLLISRPKDALRLVKAGVPIRDINVGPLRYRRKSVFLTESVYLEEEDISACRHLGAMGCRIEVRPTPNDHGRNLLELLEGKRG